MEARLGKRSLLDAVVSGGLLSRNVHNSAKRVADLGVYLARLESGIDLTDKREEKLRAELYNFFLRDFRKSGLSVIGGRTVCSPNTTHGSLEIS